jgi:hypothetical protein
MFRLYSFFAAKLPIILVFQSFGYQRKYRINIIKRLYTSFENLSTENRFIWLLSCEDKEIILLTSKLLIDLFKERK